MMSPIAAKRLKSVGLAQILIDRGSILGEIYFLYF